MSTQRFVRTVCDRCGFSEIRGEREDHPPKWGGVSLMDDGVTAGHWGLCPACVAAFRVFASGVLVAPLAMAASGVRKEQP